MTAWVAAKKAVDAGMGFVYLKSVLDLEAGFHFARMYQDPKGVVVFSEDVDSAIPNHESPEMRNLQNAFDGVDTKNDKIITILTTNHLDKVPQSLLRPGRIDVAVIVREPDAQAAIRLIKQYGGNRLAANTNFEKIGAALQGHLPAEIRESVERAKMAAISRLCYEGADPSTVSIEGSINDQDILDVVRANETQHELLKPKAPDTRSDREKAADRYGKALKEGLGVVADTLASAIKGQDHVGYDEFDEPVGVGGNGDRHLDFGEDRLEDESYDPA
jgi:transitional endoplasmic reticulum ATPase